MANEKKNSYDYDKSGKDKYQPAGGWSDGVDDATKNWYYAREKTKEFEGNVQNTATDLGNSQKLADGTTLKTATRYGLTFKAYMASVGKDVSKMTKAETDKWIGGFNNTTQDQVEGIFKRQYWDKYNLGQIKDRHVAATIYDAAVNQGYNLGTGNSNSTLMRVMKELGIKGDNSSLENAISSINNAIDSQGGDKVLEAYNNTREESYWNSQDIDDSAHGWMSRLNKQRNDGNKKSDYELRAIKDTQDSGGFKPGAGEENKAALAATQEKFDKDLQGERDVIDASTEELQPGELDLADIIRRSEAGEEITEAEQNYYDTTFQNAFINNDEEAIALYNDAKKEAGYPDLMTNKELLEAELNDIQLRQDQTGGLGPAINIEQQVAEQTEENTGYVSGDSTEQDALIQAEKDKQSRLKNQQDALDRHQGRLDKLMEEYDDPKYGPKKPKTDAEIDAAKAEQNAKRMRAAEGVLSGLKAAAGITSLSQALRDPDVETPEISPLVIEALNKQKQLANSGLTAAEKAAAMQNLDNAYAGAMKNVLRASGGQRGLFLANQGVVDANRIAGLNQLAAEDAKLHRENIKQYNSLASAVGTMQLNRDMNVEQMRQTTLNNNRQVLSGIGQNLLSDALSDVSYYLNPNRKKTEALTQQMLDQLAGNSGNKANTDIINQDVGTASVTTSDADDASDANDDNKPE
tara:strand:- start:9961 stop:12033 length:2073 start_codon:yes stop_codon:yes gene_type:complete